MIPGANGAIKDAMKVLCRISDSLRRQNALTSAMWLYDRVPREEKSAYADAIVDIYKSEYSAPKSSH